MQLEVSFFPFSFPSIYTFQTTWEDPSSSRSPLSEKGRNRSAPWSTDPQYLSVGDTAWPTTAWSSTEAASGMIQISGWSKKPKHKLRSTHIPQRAAQSKSWAQLRQLGHGQGCTGEAAQGRWNPLVTSGPWQPHSSYKTTNISLKMILTLLYMIKYHTCWTVIVWMAATPPNYTS